MKESTITAIRSLRDGVAICTYWQNRARKQQEEFWEKKADEYEQMDKESKRNE